MRFLSEPRTAAPTKCPYLPDRAFVQDYFFADGLSSREFSALLAVGWRRFGTFFFRPACPECSQCIPIRIDARSLVPTRSQRRAIVRGRDIRMAAVEPRATDEAWRVYSEHSRAQFGRDVDRDDFEKTFFEDAVPAFQTEYRLDGELIAVGFLDAGSDGMSSAYFSFHPGWARYSLGTLSVFRESSFVLESGGRWYYLGYWVPGSPSMDYKVRFAPHELLDADTGLWIPSKDHPAARPGTG